MKRACLAVGAAFAAALVSVPAQAEEVTLTACTKDSQTATISGNVTGTLEDGTKMVDLVRQAFAETAKAMNAAEWTGQAGGPALGATIIKLWNNRKYSPDTQIVFNTAPAASPAPCKP